MTHVLNYWFCSDAVCKAACQCLTVIGLFRGHRVSFDSTGNRLGETSSVPVKSYSCSRCENSNDRRMFWICQSQSKVPSVHQITCFCVRVCVWEERDKPTGNSLTNTPKDPLLHTGISVFSERWFFFYTYCNVLDNNNNNLHSTANIYHTCQT